MEPKLELGVPAPDGGAHPLAYKVEVIADSSGKWCGNALRFETEEQARQYGENLFMRWTAVREWRVVLADEVLP